MDDGNTPVEGPVASAEVRSRSEGELPWRKRRSEGVCHPESLIFQSPDVDSASGRVAELFCAVQLLAWVSSAHS